MKKYTFGTLKLGFGSQESAIAVALRRLRQTPQRAVATCSTVFGKRQSLGERRSQLGGRSSEKPSLSSMPLPLVPFTKCCIPVSVCGPRPTGTSTKHLVNLLRLRGATPSSQYASVSAVAAAGGGIPSGVTERTNDANKGAGRASVAANVGSISLRARAPVASANTTVARMVAARVRSGALASDNAQERAIAALDEMRERVNVSQRRLITRLAQLAPALVAPSAAPTGVYLYGRPGSGKTMIMDMFCASLTVPYVRLHFDAFMASVHMRYRDAAGASAGGSSAFDLLATELARKARVLCLDEMQVVHISDAMVLRQVLDAIVRAGTALVMTSNRKPSELYLGGLQRESFLPCIHLIEKACKVVDVPCKADYRSFLNSADAKSNTSATQKNYSCGDIATMTICEIEKKSKVSMKPRHIDHNGRTTHVPLQIARTAAVFDFAALCHDHPYGAQDYIALTQEYPTIVIKKLPALRVGADRSALRRFITFIDAAYEARTRLLISEAAAPLNELIIDDVSTNVSANANVEGNQTTSITHDEELFAAARLTSRIKQMTTATSSYHKAAY